MTTPKRKLRSAEGFGTADKNGFMYRSWMKNQGIPDHAFDGRPVIGICNTWSELTPCNAHFRKIAEHVKRGIYEAGGFPVEFPVFSNGESNLRPTAMLTRIAEFGVSPNKAAALGLNLLLLVHLAGSAVLAARFLRHRPLDALVRWHTRFLPVYAVWAAVVVVALPPLFGFV